MSLSENQNNFVKRSLGLFDAFGITIYSGVLNNKKIVEPASNIHLINEHQDLHLAGIQSGGNTGLITMNPLSNMEEAIYRLSNGFSRHGVNYSECKLISDPIGLGMNGVYSAMSEHFKNKYELDFLSSGSTKVMTTFYHMCSAISSYLDEFKDEEREVYNYMALSRTDRNFGITIYLRVKCCGITTELEYSVDGVLDREVPYHTSEQAKEVARIAAVAFRATQAAVEEEIFTKPWEDMDIQEQALWGAIISRHLQDSKTDVQRLFLNLQSLSLTNDVAWGQLTHMGKFKYMTVFNAIVSKLLDLGITK